MPEEYKKGMLLMQMTMQYVLESMKKLQGHIAVLQQNAGQESAARDKFREVIHKQVRSRDPIAVEGEARGPKAEPGDNK